MSPKYSHIGEDLVEGESQHVLRVFPRRGELSLQAGPGGNDSELRFLFRGQAEMFRKGRKPGSNGIFVLAGIIIVVILLKWIWI